MKISEKKHSELYKAISDPIMDLRIKRNMNDVYDMDRELFDLEMDIYAKIKNVLNLTK